LLWPRTLSTMRRDAIPPAMTLTLLAVALNDQPLSQPIVAQFDAAGGTIGRADHNTMALPDPERHISRLQAEVVVRGRGFVIRNVGGANPIVAAGRTLSRGDATALTDGDEIRIGGYLLRAQCSDDAVSGDTTRGRARFATTAGRATAGPTAQAPRQQPAGKRGSRPAAAPAAEDSAAEGISEANPFAELLGAPAPGLAGAPSADPFADLLPPPAGVTPDSAALPPPGAPDAPARLPDDFDPFATPAPRPAAPDATSAPAGGSGVFGDLVPGAGPAGGAFDDIAPAAAPRAIDEMFGLGPDASGHDPLAGFLADLGQLASDTQVDARASGRPPAADRRDEGSPLPLDPLALFGGAASPPADAEFPQSDHVAAIHTAFSPPRRADEAAASAPAVAPTTAAVASWREAAAADAPASRGASGQARAAGGQRVEGATKLASDAQDAAAAWAALCAGAGIELPMPTSTSGETFERIGRILRAAVEGTLQLVAVRASTKHELRAAVTVIRPRDNNPLKFAPDARAALEQLLQPAARGFLDGPAAMDDAMRDLVGHSIGTVAGMRAAIAGMLDRFAPEALQAKMVAPTVFDSLLPMNRKARLWELYLQHYGAIREEAEDDFHTLFGKAFLAAYEQQVERLAREARASIEAAPEPRP